ncbi:hypothetical protein NDU88_002514 [Pleurodeles waltl]|uniref:Uncharacterized protein n=1 Tax=Pleurodeles waltl TaxID=8319 RepID=A0AAV7W3I8_PLEWA|nr:hypothetical protein NDU88_002514 [Pleurodeles waltl]
MKTNRVQGNEMVTQEAHGERQKNTRTLVGRQVTLINTEKTCLELLYYEIFKTSQEHLSTFNTNFLLEGNLKIKT